MTSGFHRVLAWLGASRVTAPTACGLTLRIEPTTVELRLNQKLGVTASLTNNGKRALSLVLPGDGSRMGKRTPVIEWIFMPGGTLEGFEGCGNINGVKQGEVFTLQPGETREIREWIRPLALPDSGRSRAVMIYSNKPELPFRGVPLPAHDQAELARLRRTDRCRVQSNEIDILIRKEPPL